MSSIAFALLVIVAGMFLLAKTQKESLSKFFKVISYFVIVSGFLLIFASITRCVVRCAMRHEDRNGECGMMMHRRGMMMMERNYRFGEDGGMDFHHHGRFSGKMMDSERINKTVMDSDKVNSQK